MKKSTLNSVLIAGFIIASTGTAVFAHKISATEDSKAQIRLLLEDDSLMQAIGNRRIDAVTYTGSVYGVSNSWVINAEGCIIPVTLNVTPPKVTATIGITYTVQPTSIDCK